MTPKIVEATEVQFEEVPAVEEPKNILEEEPVLQAPAVNPVGECILMPEARTYPLGFLYLKKICLEENNQNQPKFILPEGNVVYRPLTFKENCLARMHQFNTLTNSDGSPRTLDQRMEFMLAWNDSCCGIAYPAAEKNSHKFKLILQNMQLIEVPWDFNQKFISVDYDKLSCTRELDREGADYGKNLYPKEIDTHEGWLTLFEDEAATLRDYRKMMGEVLALIHPDDPPPAFMGFWLLHKPNEDQLRGLYVSDIATSCSHAIGDDVLNCNSRFLYRKP